MLYGSQPEGEVYEVVNFKMSGRQRKWRVETVGMRHESLSGPTTERRLSSMYLWLAV